MKDEKARFFAQYLGSEVDISSTEYFIEQAKWGKPVTTCKLFGIRSDLNKDWNIAFMQTNIITQNEGVLMFKVDVCSLLLKPLSAISDEDVIELGRIFGYGKGGDGNCIEWGKWWLNNEKAGNGWSYVRAIQAVDFLRSKSYALSFMQYSVEQLIEIGWVKLKTD